jgi:hypothetical protein
VVSFSVQSLFSRTKITLLQTVGTGTLAIPYGKYQGIKKEVHYTGLTPKLAKAGTNIKHTKQGHTLPCFYKNNDNITLPLQ